jgi:amino acid adenylation domain-containing protein/FkbM family methyltransferase
MQGSGRVIKGYQLSPQQRLIWRLSEDSQAYFAQCAILIDGAVESASLEAALEKTLQQHEILRAAFEWAPEYDAPLQIILENPPLRYRSVDLTDLNDEERERVFAQVLDEESSGIDRKQETARFCSVRFSTRKTILIVSISALCGDSKTLKNLFREISSLYAQQHENRELSGGSVQYLQFSEWQNELLSESRKETVSRSIELQNTAPSYIFALESTSVANESNDSRYSPRVSSITLSPEIARRIEAVAESRNWSMADFLLAGWRVFLYRHTGNEEIVIEKLYDGRPFEELQDAIGLYAGYLPTEEILAPDMGFDESVERSRRRVSQANAQHVFHIGERAAGKGTGRGNAIGFDYEEWPQDEIVGGVKFSYWKQCCCIDRFKLKLSGRRVQGSLRIEIQYDAERFSQAGVELLLGRFQKLIESAANNERALIRELELIGGNEVNDLLVEWNNTKREPLEYQCIHELIITQTRKTPDRIALIDRERQVSYQELDRRSSLLGSYLQSLGVGPDIVVGVFLERSVEIMVGLLGALKAGGAYLPLDTESPLERLSFMLEDAGVGIVLTQRVLEDRLPVFWGQTLCLDEAWGERSEESGMGLMSFVNGDNLAYVIYTSGSTGKPKGVMVRHRGLVNYTTAICNQLALMDRGDEQLKFATVSTITADLGNTCLYPSLASGSMLHILNYETATDGAQFEEYFKKERIDVLKIVPSHMSALLGSQPQSGGMLPGQFLILGGEALSIELIEQIRRHERRCELINHYGPTETTIGSLTAKISEMELDAGRSATAPIGRPIANTDSYILNPDLTLAAVGERGELYLGGDGIARGYWGRPELTAEKFIPSPYHGEIGGRLYKTGDICRRRPEGVIEFIGRADEQVKLRGYRIELGEIQEALRSHVGVKDAVVVLREDEPNQKRLVAYVTAKNGKSINGKNRRRMPNGMSIVEQNRNETDYLYEEIFKRKRYFKQGISLPDGGCVFDVGANIGLFTLFVSQNRQGLRVYAFEPIKPIFETLKTNTELYGSAAVKLFNLGVGDESKKEWFTYYRGYSMMSGESRYATVSEDIEVVKKCMVNDDAPKELLNEADDVLKRRFEEVKYQCQLLKLSDVIREEKIERIDLLKVDVQRAELDVLNGLEERDWAKIDQLVMEVHDQSGGLTEGRLGVIKNLLEGKGYGVIVEQDEALNGTDRFNLYAKRNGYVKPAKEMIWKEVSISNAADELTTDSLKKYTKEKLPDYMTPAAFVLMDKFPLTRNGKIDRATLPRPEEIVKENEVEETSNWSLFEELISGIWKEVLKVDRVGREDNFFEIGGHSLLATLVVSRIRNVFGIEIGVLSIFDEPTLFGFAGIVQGAVKKGKNNHARPLVRTPRDQPPPLSFAQQRLWFLDQLAPQSPFYNLPRAVRLHGALDIDVLTRVINEIIRRHESLRTRIKVINQGEAPEPVQMIDEWVPREFEVIDLMAFPRSERDQEAWEVVDKDADEGFDLSEGPLLRVKIVKLDEAEHIVLFTMHHIVSDGWSLGVLTREIETLYHAYLAGETSPLPELDLQYADYAVWQREYLSGEILENEVRYWKDRLAGAPALQLPGDFPRPAAPSHRGGVVRVRIEKEVSDELRKLCQAETTTIFMALMGALKVVLLRYSGEEDLSVGTVVANRTRKELEGLIGFFVNTLVLRTDLGGNPSFREVIRRERAAALGAYTHQDAPFEKLVEEINPNRDLSRSPLFQALMALQNNERASLSLKGLKLDRVNEGARVAKYDLTLNLTEEDDGISGGLNYSRDLFEESTAQRMAGHLEKVVREIARNAEQRVKDIELISEEEKRQIVHMGARSKIDSLSDVYAHELFESQSELGPDAIAISQGREQISYRELNRRASQLGRYLRERGVENGAIVGVCLERSIEAIIALMAVWKAGGANLPLDPSYPGHRLQSMMEDAAASFMLTNGPDINWSESIDIPVVDLKMEWKAVENYSVAVSTPKALGDDLAYLIFTSGSTGRPKGVMVTHNNLSGLLSVCQRHFQFCANEEMLCLASFSFDISFFELLNPLVVGGKINLLGRDEILNSDQLLFEIGNCNIIHAVPTLMKQIVEGVKNKGGNTSDYKNINKVFVGGELVPAELLEEMTHVFTAAQIHVLYGPTEGTIICSSQAVAPETIGKRNIIGAPLDNSILNIYDENGHLLSFGIPGELCIGGDGVARGYLNRPELTAERFIPDAYAGEPGARMYRTGDLVRCLQNGQLEYLGRGDRQVKIRGHRIELGEIEARLAEHPAIQTAIVSAVEDHRREKRLVAYLVARTNPELLFMEAGSGKEISVEQDPGMDASQRGREIFPENLARELRAHLNKYLPEYMTPSIFKLIDKTPMTPSGKIDRRALPAIEDEDLGLKRDYVAPRTPIEEMMAGIWGGLLGVERIGVAENFFELGGHSLLATQVISRVRAAFNVEIGVKSIFEAPTIEDVSARVVEAINEGREHTGPPLVKSHRTGNPPLSFAQQRMWFLAQMMPNNPFYNLPGAVRLEGKLDLDLLQRVINEVVRRHEILRTRIIVENNAPVQVIDEWKPKSIEVLTLTALTDDKKDSELSRIGREEAETGFDLSLGPLLRIRILKLEEEAYVVFFTFHHVVSDAWSMSVLMREISVLYEAMSLGLKSPLKELDIQYADYAVWQRAYLDSGVLKDEVDYWREQLDGATAMELPTDRVRPSAPSYRGGREQIAISKDVYRELRRFSQKEAATVFMSLMAVLKVVLMRYTGEDDISVGTVIANRTRKEIEGLIGFFVNTLVMRTRLEGNLSYRDLVKRVREVSLGAYAHQDAPFDKLVEEINPERDLSRSPLFQIMMVLQNIEHEERQLKGLKVIGIGGDRTVTKFDLTLRLTESDDGLRGCLEYSPDLYDAETIRRLARHYENLVREALIDAGQLITELEIMSEEEKRQIVEEWNQTSREHSGRKLIHAHFNRQAERAPESIALVSERECLSYWEVSRRANQLAHHLLGRGVERETVIGVYLRRSIEIVPVLMGTLKAGAAYLPLDPESPIERLDYLLRNAGVKIVLSEQSLMDRLPALDLEYVCLDAEQESISAQSEDDPCIEIDPENLAYVIYTSGSTGQPKGTLIAHRGVSNLIEAERETFDLGRQSRVLQFASLSFDASVWEIFSALATGGSLHIYNREVLMPGPDLQRVLWEDQITMATFPPSVLRNLDERGLPNLQIVVAAGEPCTAEIVERWGIERRFFDAYGPTETTVCASIGECKAGDNKKPTIGRPIVNTNIYLLDQNLQPVPVGVRGELYISGVGVARNYLGRPELSAERFIPSPFGSQAGVRLYKSGDIAKYSRDGRLEYIERIDHQIKIRGHRIEPAEIENALLQIPAVTESVVIARDDEADGKRLTAYLVLERGVEKTALELRRFLKQRLPAYMVPSSFVILESLPLTSQGKVDRRRLPPPERREVELGSVYVSPGTALEEAVAQIFREVLGIEDIGVYDDFFALGGHSLLVTQVLNRIYEIFEVKLSMGSLFEAPTINDLAALIVENQAKQFDEDTLYQLLAEIESPSEKGAAAD